MIVIKGLTGIARRMFREESQARHGFGPTGLAPDFFSACALCRSWTIHRGKER
jgi:hypothetical protein